MDKNRGKIAQIKLSKAVKALQIIKSKTDVAPGVTMPVGALANGALKEVGEYSCLILKRNF
jgi:hypothetical protein